MTQRNLGFYLPSYIIQFLQIEQNNCMFTNLLYSLSSVLAKIIYMFLLWVCAAPQMKRTNMEDSVKIARHNHDLLGFHSSKGVRTRRNTIFLASRWINHSIYLSSVFWLEGFASSSVSWSLYPSCFSLYIYICSLFVFCLVCFTFS